MAVRLNPDDLLGDERVTREEKRIEGEMREEKDFSFGVAACDVLHWTHARNPSRQSRSVEQPTQKK